MRLHERETRTLTAESELSSAILDIIKRHELTEGEALRVVNAAASGYIGSVAKYAIRAERHPDDPDRPGGLE